MKINPALTSFLAILMAVRGAVAAPSHCTSELEGLDPKRAYSGQVTAWVTEGTQQGKKIVGQLLGAPAIVKVRTTRFGVLTVDAKMISQVEGKFASPAELFAYSKQLLKEGKQPGVSVLLSRLDQDVYGYVIEAYDEGEQALIEAEGSTGVLEYYSVPYKAVSKVARVPSRSDQGEYLANLEKVKNLLGKEQIAADRSFLKEHFNFNFDRFLNPSVQKRVTALEDFRQVVYQKWIETQFRPLTDAGFAKLKSQSSLKTPLLNAQLAKGKDALRVYVRSATSFVLTDGQKTIGYNFSKVVQVELFEGAEYHDTSRMASLAHILKMDPTLIILPTSKALTISDFSSSAAEKYFFPLGLLEPGKKAFADGSEYDFFTFLVHDINHTASYWEDAMIFSPDWPTQKKALRVVQAEIDQVIAHESDPEKKELMSRIAFYLGHEGTSFRWTPGEIAQYKKAGFRWLWQPLELLDAVWGRSIPGDFEPFPSLVGVNDPTEQQIKAAKDKLNDAFTELWGALSDFQR